MQNMQIILYPKQLHYTSQFPINIRLVYKKVCITTNHELQKYQNRQSYPIKNGIAVINGQVKFKLSKQFQMNNTKLVVIVIGLKGRQITCLGDISLDLALLYKQKQKAQHTNNIINTNKSQNRVHKTPKHICHMILNSFKKNQPIKKSRKQHMPQLGILKTQYHYKEDLYISRRQKQDKPTAYQISRKNFKTNQIRRNNDTIHNTYTNNHNIHNHNQSQQKRSAGSTGSYKKRFQYDVSRIDKSRKKTNRQIGSNYLKVYKKDKSPSPRIKTPQPITIESIKNNYYQQMIKQNNQNRSNQTTKRVYNNNKNSEYKINKQQQKNIRINKLNLSSQHKVNKNNDNYQQQSSQLGEPDTFRAREDESSTISECQSHHNGTHHIQHSYKSHTLNNINSNNSQLNQQKQHKYRTITQKLQMIENKIRKQKQKYNHGNSEQLNGYCQNYQHNQQQYYRKNKNNQIQQIYAYEIIQNSRKTVPKRIQESNHINNYYFRQFDGQNNKHNQSIQQSTCPRNQKPPSPIQIAQTPSVNINKNSNQISIKMSQFTINSKKNQTQSDYKSSIQQYEQVKQVNKISKFQQIQELSSEDSRKNKQHNNIKQINNINTTNNNNNINNTNTKNNIATNITTKIIKSRPANPFNLDSPSYHQKRQLSPSFQKRKSQLQLQKKNSIGTNYLETQVKMQQLQIQKKIINIKNYQKKNQNNKIQNQKNKIQNQKRKVENDKRKVEEENLRLIQQVEFYQGQYNQLSIQLDKYKQSNLNNNHHNSQIQQQLIQKINQLSTKLKQLQQQNIQLSRSLNLQAKYFAQQFNKTNGMMNTQKSSQQQPIRQNKQNKYTLTNLLSTLHQKQQQLSTYRQKIQQLNFYKIKYDEVYKQLNNQKLQKGKQLEKIRLLKEEQINRLKLNQNQQRIKINIFSNQLQSLKQINKKLKQNIQQRLKQDKKYNKQQQLINSKTININSQSQSQQSQPKQQPSQIQQKLRQYEQNMIKKQKVIQKLSSVNQTINQQIYSLKQQSIKRINELDQQIQQLLMKNMQSQQTIKQLKYILQQKQKQLNQMKKSLSLSNSNNNNVIKQKQLNKQYIKSDNLLKIKQIDENLEQKYENERKKCYNLQSQLKFAQNKIRTISLQLENTKLQKKQLEQEMNILSKKQLTMQKNKSMQKKNTSIISQRQQNNEHNEYIKNNEHISNNNNTNEYIKKNNTTLINKQNSVLKEQIKHLQHQVSQLNTLLDTVISKSSSIQLSKLLSIPSSSSNKQNNQKSISLQKYVILARRLQAYQHELRTKKNKMAEIINCVWKGGNADLIDQIDKVMEIQ